MRFDPRAEFGVGIAVITEGFVFNVDRPNGSSLRIMPVAFMDDLAICLPAGDARSVISLSLSLSLRAVRIVYNTFALFSSTYVQMRTNGKRRLERRVAPLRNTESHTRI